jgi:hypothetical protein
MMPDTAWMIKAETMGASMKLVLSFLQTCRKNDICNSDMSESRAECEEITGVLMTVSPYQINIRIKNPYADKETILRQVRDLIDELRNDPYHTKGAQ